MANNIKDDNNKKRAMLNTTIDSNVLNDFREYCKSINAPMNTILEIFMKCFVTGQISLYFKKNEMKLDIEE